MKNREMPVPTEAAEQRAVIRWAQAHDHIYPELMMLFAIPNGGWLNNPKYAATLKYQGLKKGVPDLFLPVSNGGYNGLFVEMKRRKGGKPSAYQLQWIERLREYGYSAEICYGSDAAIAVIEKYLRES